MPESLIYLRRVGRRRTLNNLPVWFPLLRHSLGIERLGLVADRKRKLLRSLSVTKPNRSIPKPGHRPSDITMEGREGGAKEGGQSGSPLFILGRFVNAVVISHAADLLDTTSQSHTHRWKGETDGLSGYGHRKRFPSLLTKQSHHFRCGGRQPSLWRNNQR